MKATDKRPLISVLMPAYNSEAYIQEAIECILRQSYTNFELLICDDGSSDNTMKVILEFTDPRINVTRNEKNLGSLESRNNLLEVAKGELITFQDADDLCSPDRLEIQASRMINDDELIMCGSYCIKFYENSRKKKVTYPTDSDSIINNARKGETSLFCAASVMLSREALNKVGYYDMFFSRIGSYDIDWHLRAILKGKVCNIAKYLYQYRQHSASFTQSSVTNPAYDSSADIALALFLIREVKNRDPREDEKIKIYSLSISHSKISHEKPKEIIKSAFYRNKKKTLNLIISAINNQNYRTFDIVSYASKALIYLIISPLIPNRLLRLAVRKKRLKKARNLLTAIDDMQ